MSSEADEGAAEEAGASQPATEQAGPGNGHREDSTRQQVVEALKAELDDAVVASEVSGGDVWVRVDRTAWRQAAEACRRRLDMDYFCFLSGIDWLVNPELSGEKRWDPAGEAPEPETGAEDEGYQTGVTGGETRFQLLARLYSTIRKVGVTLKADLDEEDPRVASLVSVYRGADWHEREAWEMYGFTFEGHPGLRHLYLPGEFEGHPLRKDFPLLAREVKPWPGLVDVEPIPGEEAPGEGGPEDEGAGAETGVATGEGG
ncbi:MAG: NADH-quinone oxidoreductase subunit C [Actinomycetota bacterium]|nr:NADH-quinone oxidoreductase subunit C [Actinomycetota bacterium]